MTQLQPRIYVACLAAYHSGILYGKWINANQDVAALKLAVEKVIAKSPAADADEWAIQAQNDFGDAILSEHESLENISKIAAFIVEHGELGAALFGHFHNVNDAKRAIEEEYHGAYENQEAFASQLFDENVKAYFEEIIRQWSSKDLDYFNDMMRYIDYESYQRDIFINDFFALEVEGNTHVFSYF